MIVLIGIVQESFAKQWIICLTRWTVCRTMSVRSDLYVSAQNTEFPEQSFSLVGEGSISSAGNVAIKFKNVHRNEHGCLLLSNVLFAC